MRQSQRDFLRRHPEIIGIVSMAIAAILLALFPLTGGVNCDARHQSPGIGRCDTWKPLTTLI